MEDGIQHTHTAGGGQELIPESEQSTDGNDVVQRDSIIRVVDHIHHLSAAATQHFNHRPYGFSAGFNVDVFKRFEQFAVFARVHNGFGRETWNS